MEDLVGRGKELAYLSNVYDKAPVSCAVCGRRHLGKTAVIREFCRDKHYIYVSGMIGLSSDNLREISKEFTSFAGSRVDLEDVADFLPWLKKICGKKKVVVVIDNYSDLVDNFPEFTSYMRQFINRDLPFTRMMLIVCDNDSSVFGRFYYTLDIRAMSYRDCIGFHPDYTPLQHLIAYSVVGGTPAYQHLFQGDPGEAIRTHFFGHMAVFLLEIESMLGSEPIARLNSTKVLAAIASGAETLNDIAERANLRSAVARDAIEDMENKGMVRREVSPTKRTVYSIHSNILRFYFTIVARYQPRVAFMSGNDAYEMAKADIDRYLESMFEHVCVDYVNYAFRCDGVGKPRKKDNSPDEIVNFVAVVDENRVKRSMFATCRMYGDKFGKGDLEDLKERSKAIKGSNRLYVMFSAAGFSVDLRDIASKDPNVRLVSLEDMYARSQDKGKGFGRGQRPLCAIVSPRRTLCRWGFRR